MLLPLGNHEDIMVTVRYGFHNEVNLKYRVGDRRFGRHVHSMDWKRLDPKSPVDRSVQRHIQLAATLLVHRCRQEQDYRHARRYLRPNQPKKAEQRGEESM